MSQLIEGLTEAIQLCDQIEEVLTAPSDLAPKTLDLSPQDLLILARVARQAARASLPVAEQVESAFHAGWAGHDSTVAVEEAFARYLTGLDQ
jgi:hypothetical protein